ncbi:MAG: hypothetical protein ACI4R8_01295 [Candidatus Caccovivens sp.]
MAQLTHWKSFKDNNYLGAYNLEPGKDMVVTIKKVDKGEIIGENGEKDKGSLIWFNEYEKPMILNTTNATAIATIYDTPYVEEWVGKKIQLYQTSIRAFGSDWDVLRVRKWNPSVCTDCKKQLEAFQNMTAEQLAVYTTAKYKHPLCAECAQKKAGSK